MRQCSQKERLQSVAVTDFMIGRRAVNQHAVDLPKFALRINGCKLTAILEERDFWKFLFPVYSLEDVI